MWFLIESCATNKWSLCPIFFFVFQGLLTTFDRKHSCSHVESFRFLTVIVYLQRPLSCDKIAGKIEECSMLHTFFSYVCQKVWTGENFKQ